MTVLKCRVKRPETWIIRTANPNTMSTVQVRIRNKRRNIRLKTTVCGGIAYTQTPVETLFGFLRTNDSTNKRVIGAFSRVAKCKKVA